MHEKTARQELIAESAAAIDAGELLRDVMKRDPRYSFGAYMWILAEGLEYVMKTHLGLSEDQRRHMSGQEIMWGLRALAIDQFGPLACDVWNFWGIRTTRDWGEVVFNLIDAGLLHKTEKDNIKDFEDVFEINQEMGR
jgi:uncharacterized repeat protein (TIGR04138 family)